MAIELLTLFLNAEFSADPDVRRRVQKLAEMDSALAGSKKAL